MNLKVLSSLAFAAVCATALGQVAQPAQAPQPTVAAGRVLHFPADRSLGRLFVLDAGVRRQIEDFYYHIDGTEDKWVYLGEAQGHVTIPAGKRVRLAVGESACTRLSPLARLEPDGLDELLLAFTPADDRCMPHIGRLTGLRVLNLQGTPVSDVGLRHLAGMKSLERLHLPDRISDGGMAHVGQVRSLKSLCFGSNRVTDAGLIHLAGLTSLEELSLGGKTQDTQGNPLPSLITDAGLVHLGKLPNLWYLNLWGDFTDAGLVHLNSIPSLRTLSLSGLPITDAGLVHLSGLAGLETLDLYGTEVTDAGLVHLKPMRSLRQLYLRKKPDQASRKDPFFTDEGMDVLKEIKTLECVALPADGISDRGVAALAQLGHLKRLELPMPHWIDPKRYRTPYTERGLHELAKVQTLEELQLAGPGVTDAALAQVARLKNLRSLTLFACPISDDGLAQLAACKSMEAFELMGHHEDSTITISGLNRLRTLSRLSNLRAGSLLGGGGTLDIATLTRLEHLSLSCEKGSGLCDDDLACLKHLTRLKSVGLGGAITDVGMAHLAGLTSIQRLTVGGPGITDRGLEYLAEMAGMDVLTISGTFTDDGLRHLERLKAIRILRVTSGCNLSSAAKARLRKNLPSLCSFTADDDRAVGREPARVREAETTNRPVSDAKDDAVDAISAALPKPGSPAPDFTVTTLDGNEFKLSEQRGKVVLLHFWATWCRPCVASVPGLKTWEDNLKKKYGDRVVVIKLAMDDMDAKVRSFVESKQWSGIHARIGMQSRLAADYGVEGAPDDFMIGPDGRILLNRESPEGPEDTEAVIDKALAAGR